MSYILNMRGNWQTLQLVQQTTVWFFFFSSCLREQFLLHQSLLGITLCKPLADFFCSVAWFLLLHSLCVSGLGLVTRATWCHPHVLTAQASLVPLRAGHEVLQGGSSDLPPWTPQQAHEHNWQMLLPLKLWGSERRSRTNVAIGQSMRKLAQGILGISCSTFPDSSVFAGDSFTRFNTLLL